MQNRRNVIQSIIRAVYIDLYRISRRPISLQFFFFRRESQIPKELEGELMSSWSFN
jgi:hypothetical protein